MGGWLENRDRLFWREKKLIGQKLGETLRCGRSIYLRKLGEAKWGPWDPCCSAQRVFMEVRKSGSALGAPVSAYWLHIKDSTNSEQIENNQGGCVFMSVGTALCSCHYSMGYSTSYITLILGWYLANSTREDVYGFYSVQIVCHAETWVLVTMADHGTLPWGSWGLSVFQDNWHSDCFLPSHHVAAC